LTERVTEADEMYQNAGEKGTPHPDPDDPPRRRANKARGHGTWENDRPAVGGIAGRERASLRLEVCPRTDRATLQPFVEAQTRSDCHIYTDEWHAYDHLGDTGRTHQTVCHAQREWARDADGDGIREVHCNTLEGLWTGLRNFLRIFRGVHKKYLRQYVKVFEWGYTFKHLTDEALRMMVIPFTPDTT
jgi:transposase-like protein